MTLLETVLKISRNGTFKCAEPMCNAQTTGFYTQGGDHWKLCADCLNRLRRGRDLELEGIMPRGQ